ncbi:MAG: aldehyde dehydrogenase family protein, partial [Burkholderiales bacterium]|nr:aldehyde dehydrogenase family protein [Anaerolineae bacterium]
MAADAKFVEVVNPYDGSVVERVPEADEAAVQAAIGAAEAMRGTMASMTANRRGAILNQTSRLLEEQTNDIAQLMAKESGKPMRYAKGEVGRAVETFMFAADEARRMHGETIPLD